jgi:hypothetical protein
MRKNPSEVVWWTPTLENETFQGSGHLRDAASPLIAMVGLPLHFCGTVLALHTGRFDCQSELLDTSDAWELRLPLGMLEADGMLGSVGWREAGVQRNEFSEYRSIDLIRQVSQRDQAQHISEYIPLVPDVQGQFG